MERTRATGLAALIILGGAAGFVVATSALGQDFQAIGLAADAGRAYTLDADDGVVRFEMKAVDRAIDPAATFALYAPDDAFFGFYELNADWPTEDVHVDQAGEWVVVIYELREAELSVAGDNDSLLDNAKLEPAETTEERVTVAEADGEPVRISSSIATDKRPAQALLEYNGSVKALDAVVSTPDGPVFELIGVSTNTTEDGETYQVAGSTIASPQNLADGTFQVRLTADALDGSVDLVLVDYIRDGVEAIEKGSVDCDQVKASDEEEHDHAEAGDEEDEEAPPCLVSTDGVINLFVHEPIAFEATESASALELTFDQVRFVDLSIYDASDNLVQHVQIGEAPEYYYQYQYSPTDWSSRSGATLTDEIVTVPLNTTGEHVIFVRGFWGDVAEARVLGLDAAPSARVLEMSTAEVYASDLVKLDSETFQVGTLAPLLDVRPFDMSFADVAHELTVTGPDGVVLHSYRDISTFGVTVGQSGYEVNPELFVNGDYEVTWDGQGAFSDMHLLFLTYDR